MGRLHEERDLGVILVIGSNNLGEPWILLQFAKEIDEFWGRFHVVWNDRPHLHALFGPVHTLDDSAILDRAEVDVRHVHQFHGIV